MDDNIPVTSPTSTSPAAPESISPTLDWILFGVTAAGAAVVYIALFNQSWIGFTIGEIICGGVWVGGSFYKWNCGRKARRAGGIDAPFEGMGNRGQH